MDLRPEALAELNKQEWARGTPQHRERVLFSAPVMSLGLLLLSAALSLVVPSPERVSGRGLVRVPGSVYLRSEATGGMRRVVISAGDRVCEGQTLVELDNPEVEGQLRRARGRYDQALTSMLRSPANPALRAAVGEARVELAQLRDQLDALKLRSPIDATVVSVRAHEGGLVEASDIVATLAGTDDADGSRPYLVASFPNATLGLIEEGTELELIVDRAGPHRYVFVVRSVSHEAISVEDPRQRHELAPREGTDSVLVVEAELIDASASAQLNLFDGMVGEVRALVRKRSLLERVVEALGWRSGA